MDSVRTAPVKKLQLDDLVIARIAQALQEALLTGTDVTDILRAIELDTSDDRIILAAGYAELVADHHKKMLDELGALGVNNAG
jgi:Tat protein secretion system quality control protein TatD with DNase activity